MGFSLGGVGSSLGGMFGFGGGGAAGDASKALSKYLRQGSKLYDPAYNEINAMYQPYTQAGNQAMGMLQSGTASYDSPLLRKFGASDFQTDPGYQWRLQQGLSALQNSAANKGNLFSGATGKALNRYGQDFASNEYQNVYNRYVNDQATQFNNLYKLGAMGFGALGDLANSRRWATEGKAGALAGIGQAKSSGIMGAYNNKQQGFQNLLSLGSMIAGGMNPTGGGTNYMQLGGNYLSPNDSFDLGNLSFGGIDNPNQYNF